MHDIRMYIRNSYIEYSTQSIPVIIEILDLDFLYKTRKIIPMTNAERGKRMNIERIFIIVH